MGTLVVGAVVLLVVLLAVRSVIKSHKSGGCGGDCSHCRGGGCH